MKTKICTSCNSPLIKVKKGKEVVVECSYCGKSYTKLPDGFIPEYKGKK